MDYAPSFPVSDLKETSSDRILIESRSLVRNLSSQNANRVLTNRKSPYGFFSRSVFAKIVTVRSCIQWRGFGYRKKCMRFRRFRVYRRRKASLQCDPTKQNCACQASCYSKCPKTRCRNRYLGHWRGFKALRCRRKCNNICSRRSRKKKKICRRIQKCYQQRMNEV